MQAKVCGIRNDRDAAILLDAGADALGFLCGLTHMSEDKLDVSEAARLIALVQGRAVTVLVTHLSGPEEIAALFEMVGADMIQLHGEMTDEELAGTRELLPSTRLVRAVHVATGATYETVVGRARAAAIHADALLLDSRSIDRLGGTGVTHDWAVSARLVGEIPCPVVLAGGLTPANAARAIATVCPAAIDANSGLEDDKGDKSSGKVAAFVDAAHRSATDSGPAFARDRRPRGLSS